MRWRYAQATAGQEETGHGKTEMLREADASGGETRGSKDMTDTGSRRGRQEGPREKKRWRSVQRKQRRKQSEVRETLTEMRTDGDGREGTASWALGYWERPTLGSPGEH